MSTLCASVHGIAVLGPGLANWRQTAAVLRAERTYQPACTVLPLPEVLPPAERRRAGRVVKLALAVAAEAITHSGVDARTLQSVFSSSGGDGDNCHAVCETLASADRLISPTRFHNSVHNAASGYWGIAYGCMRASTALCAFDASFGAGLIEALTQISAGAAAVLLVAYDADYPSPLAAKRPITDAFGVALVLRPTAAAPALAHLRARFSHELPQRMPEPELERLRRGSPAARALPLLACLARGDSAAAVLDYLPDLSLRLELQP